MMYNERKLHQRLQKISMNPMYMVLLSHLVEVDIFIKILSN